MEDWIKDFADVMLSDKEKEILNEVMNNPDPKEKIKTMFKNFKQPTLVERYRKNEEERKLLDKEISELDDQEHESFYRKYHGIPDVQDTLDEILMEIQTLKVEVNALRAGLNK